MCLVEARGPSIKHDKLIAINMDIWKVCVCVYNWKTSHFHCLFFVFFLSLFYDQVRMEKKKFSLFSYTHHHYYPLSYKFFFFISSPRCQEKKTVAHHIDYSELGVFYLIILCCCCCDESICGLSVWEITFFFSEISSHIYLCIRDVLAVMKYFKIKVSIISTFLKDSKLKK